jgi:hypothetical protein
MDQKATPRKLSAVPSGTKAARRAAINMEFIYDTTMITAAVFVFALFLSVTT